MPKMRSTSARRAPELKASDTSVSLATDTTGAILLVNGLVPGVALNERIARLVHADKLTLRLAAAATAATGVDQIHRVMVVMDKQPNGVALAITDVVDSVNTAALLNLSNQARFKILYDRRFYLNASGEPGSLQLITDTLRLHSTVQFNAGVAGTVADITTNSIYLITIGNVVAGVGAGTVSGRVRFRFYDE